MRLVSLSNATPEMHPVGHKVKEATIRAFNPNRKIALPTMEGIHFECIHNIVSLEAKGNYTYIHFTDRKKILVCKTLRNVEIQLNDALQFVRIHRSYTINLNHIQKYVKGKGGYVLMEGGSSINVSAGKKQNFMEALQCYFS